MSRYNVYVTSEKSERISLEPYLSLWVRLRNIIYDIYANIVKPGYSILEFQSMRNLLM